MTVLFARTSNGKRQTATRMTFGFVRGRDDLASDSLFGVVIIVFVILEC